MKNVYKTRVGYGTLDSYADDTAYFAATGLITTQTSAGDFYYNSSLNCYSFFTGPSVSSTPMGGITASTPLQYNPATNTVSILQSGVAQNGYLSSGDWGTFNGKLDTELDPLSLHLTGANLMTGTIGYAVDNSQDVGYLNTYASGTDIINNITYTALATGVSGNLISISLVDDSTHPETVTVVGNVITVHFKSSQPALTSDIAYAVNNDSVSKLMVLAVDNNIAPGPSAIVAGSILSGGASVGRPKHIYAGTDVKIGHLSGEAGTLYLGAKSSRIASTSAGEITLTPFSGTNIVMSGNVTGIVEEFTGSIETVANKTYYLDLKAAYGYTINTIYIQNMNIAPGTCTAAIKINGAAVTFDISGGGSGVTSIPVSGTIALATSTAATTRVAAIGDTLTLVITSNAAALDLAFTLKATRS